MENFEIKNKFKEAPTHWIKVADLASAVIWKEPSNKMKNLFSIFSSILFVRFQTLLFYLYSKLFALKELALELGGRHLYSPMNINHSNYYW